MESANNTGDAITASNPRAISRDVFSATLGSLLNCYIGQPLDTIKVRMQTKPTEYTGVLPTIRKMMKSEVGTYYLAVFLS